jgi:pentatricopeptide repeat protein
MIVAYTDVLIVAPMTTLTKPQSYIQRNNMATPLASYNTKLESYVTQGKKSEFWNLVKEIKEKGIQPDAITWNAMITMRAASREWDEVPKALDSMRAAGFSPTTATYNKLLKVGAIESTNQ